jgi:S1-C subfamily serine protease
MKRIPLLAIALAFGSVASAQTNSTHRARNPPQPKLSARQIAQRTAPSVVLLVTTDEVGNPIALGSGFFVASDRIATNYHVIKGASQVLAKIIGRRTIYKISFVESPDEESDLVLLRIDEIKGQPLKLGNLSGLRVGDEVYVMGNPEGLEGTFSLGNVSAMRSGKGLIQITAPISHGSSGGPVLNDRGEVIGVAAGTLTEGQNLNFAIPVNKLVELLKPENDLLTGYALNTPSAPREPIAEREPPAKSNGKVVTVGIGDWTNTGIPISKGDVVTISGTGTTTLSGGVVSGPEGRLYGFNKDKAIGDQPTGALIAVVGEYASDYVFIGRAGRLVAARSGLLFLGINGSSTVRFGSYRAQILLDPPPSKSTSQVVTVGIDDWTNTGIPVLKGDVVTICGTGTTTLSDGVVSGPEGRLYELNDDKAIADRPTGALIAVVGQYATDYVLIGRAGRLVAPRNGFLFLGINGSSTVRLGRYRAQVVIERN